MGSAARWLDVEVGADDIDLNTLPSNTALLDLQNDNDFKLLVGDMGRNGSEGPKLKTFKGATQISESSLPNIPIAVVGFYSSECVPRPAPVVAVALGSGVYVYKNMKLFYKYYLPSLEQNTVELDLWRQLTDSINHTEEKILTLVNSLKTIPYNYLSPQSKRILSVNPDKYLECIKRNIDAPIQKTSEVTCMSALKINSVDKYAVSCLVLGTEEGDVIFLDPQTFTQLHHAKVCDIKLTPYQIIAMGLYDVDFRIIIATREKTVCVLKRQGKEGKSLFSTEEYIVGMEVMPSDFSVVVICLDNTMSCYSKKGKKLWSVTFEHYPVTMTLLPMSHLGTVLVGVALKSGHLQIYNGKTQVDCIFVKDVVSVMRFGQLGQEEHVLIIITMAGDLMLKILKRTADFNLDTASTDYSQSSGVISPSLQVKPWVIPKKSKLFLEQSMRERDNAPVMHRIFQQDLIRLRLTVTKALVEAHLKSENSIGVGALEPIRLSAEVEGLGPVFRVVLVLENTSAARAVSQLYILFHVHVDNYKVERPYIKVPLVVPGGKLKFPTKVEEVFPEDMVNPEIFLRNLTGQNSERSAVKILLLKEGRQAPVLAATIQMPPTDPMMVPYDKMQSAGNFV